MEPAAQDKDQAILNSEPLEKGRADWNQPKPEILPRPTFWPLVVAFGIVLVPFGIVTTLIISGVGLVILALGLAGWNGELRNE